MASDSEDSGAGLAESIMNLFSPLDMQAASQLSYLLHSAQTVKHVAISLHIKLFSCYLAFISKAHISYLQINPTRCTILLSIFIYLIYMFRATM
jgi:hypothetical protein